MLHLLLLPDDLLVARLPARAPVPAWALAAPFFSLTRTAHELSVVCSAEAAPADLPAERGWRCLQVAGPLDFSLVGILASLLAPLQAAGVSVFVISTYDTDYLMLKQEQLGRALAALRAAGHSIDS
jgi:hypothetical protein